QLPPHLQGVPPLHDQVQEVVLEARAAGERDDVAAGRHERRFETGLLQVVGEQLPEVRIRLDHARPLDGDRAHFVTPGGAGSGPRLSPTRDHPPASFRNRTTTGSAHAAYAEACADTRASTNGAPAAAGGNLADSVLVVSAVPTGVASPVLLSNRAHCTE